MVGAAPAYVVGMKDTWALTTRQPSGMRTHVWLWRPGILHPILAMLPNAD